MKLDIIGTGYVGLITGSCFAEFGYETVCIDKNQRRVDELNNSKCPFYEPGVENLLDKHLNKTNLLGFSSSLSESVKDVDIIFITVGTPSKRFEDEADLSYVWDVVEEISENINKYCVIVTKSTVPVGTTKKVKIFVFLTSSVIPCKPPTFSVSCLVFLQTPDLHLIRTQNATTYPYMWRVNRKKH